MMSEKRPHLVWVTPEKKGGIQTYTEALWPAIRRAAESAGYQVSESVYGDRVEGISPTLIHVQHEYGLFGSKTPGRYYFPRWVRQLRERFPSTKMVATAHTVLDPAYRYPVLGRGIEIPFRMLANLTVLPWFRKVWGPDTWGPLDGVLVHSRHQVAPVEQAGCRLVTCVPHFVPERVQIGATRAAAVPTVLVFGFFSPEKGQDTVIRAFAEISDARLILAGGARTSKDEEYLRECRGWIERLGLKDRVVITGYLNEADIDSYYRQATLIVAPFRATTGSGSLAQGLARGVPILASDLLLNREIEEREPGCLSFFKSENPADCARAIREMLARPDLRAALAEAAVRYSQRYSPNAVAQLHLDVYRKVLGTA